MEKYTEFLLSVWTRDELITAMAVIQKLMAYRISFRVHHHTLTTGNTGLYVRLPEGTAYTPHTQFQGLKNQLRIELGVSL